MATFGTLEKPTAKFMHSDAEQWVPFVYQLALRNLSIKHIAGACGCSHSSLQHNELIANTIREGWAEHRFGIENELWVMANTDPSLFEDKEDRISARIQKMEALKVLKKSADVQDTWVGPAEVEKIKRLTDTDLEKAIESEIAARQALKPSAHK